MALSHLDSTLAISIHMMRRNEMSKVAPLSLFAVALLFAPHQADAAPPLCTSAKGACIKTGPDAPVLRVDVCWNNVALTLKTGLACPAGAYPYYADYGEVIDPVLGLVIAYAPLPDACDMGLCELEPAPGSTSAEPLCCTPGQEGCSPDEGSCPEDYVVWCEQAASNDDGSISCYDPPG